MKQEIKVTNAKQLVAKDSIIAKAETNDCVVYATASAFNLTYDQAHGHVRHRFGRKDKRGTGTMEIVQGMKELAESKESINGMYVKEILSQPFKTYHTYGRDVNRKNRVSTFIKEHSQGTYFILVSRHALTIKDGVIIDNINKGSGSALVKRAFKIEPVGS
jgi:hypothetical protein